MCMPAATLVYLLWCIYFGVSTLVYRLFEKHYAIAFQIAATLVYLLWCIGLLH
jgi:positive regulator of sigma E activity